MTAAAPGRELLALAEWIKSSHSVDEYITVQIPIALRDSVVARLAAKPADDGWTFAKLLSNALLKIRPLGGSELFVKRNGDYYADPEYCGRMIEEMQDALHQARIEKVRLEKSISAAGEPAL